MSTLFARGSEAVRSFLEQSAVSHIQWPRLLLPDRDGSWTTVLVMDDDFGPHVVTHLKKHIIKGEDGGRDRTIYVRIPCLLEHKIDKTCALCDEGRSKYPYALLTVFDLYGYTDNEGRSYPMLKRLWTVDPGAAEQILKIRDEQGTLKGAVINVRVTDPSRFHNSGDEVVFKNMRGQEAWPKIAEHFKVKADTLAMSPFNYDAFVRPWTNDQIRAFLGGRVPTNPQAQEDAK